VRKKWLVLLCLLVIASGVALWLWSAQRSEPMPSFLLPDSNRVHLVAVTVGTNAKINFGTPIERVLARLPGELGKRFKGNEVSTFSHLSPTPSAEIVFWFRYERPPQLGTYLSAQIVEQGEPLRGRRYSSHPTTLSNGVTVAHSGTLLWPRRDRMLTVRVEQLSQATHQGVDVGQLTVANPASGNYPIWVPEKLPAARDFENTSFTLESFGRASLTRVRVISGGEPERSWEVWGHWLRDATGNLDVKRNEPQWGPTRERADSRGIITLHAWWFGMPTEPAWKVGFQFVRAGSLASNEVFVLRGVPASATGPRSSGTWGTNLPMGVVQLRYQPDWDDPSRKPCLVPYVPEVVDLANARQNPLAVVILDAVNDAGQKIRVTGERKMHIPTGSKTLDITIGIPRQHCVEYTVDPKTLDESRRSVQPISTPDHLKIPDTIRPEKILRELDK